MNFGIARLPMRRYMAKTESRLMHLLATLCLQTLILAGSAEAQNVSFIAPRAFAAGVAPFSVAVGDFNNDGLQDAAVAIMAVRNSGVSVLINNTPSQIHRRTGEHMETAVERIFLQANCI